MEQGEQGDTRTITPAGPAPMMSTSTSLWNSSSLPLKVGVAAAAVMLGRAGILGGGERGTRRRAARDGVDPGRGGDAVRLVLACQEGRIRAIEA